jgi:UDP-N-acetyl-D-glucosamine dehydrogenase
MSQSTTQVVTTAEVLSRKISDRTARVGIVGLGYVGLPLAVEFANAGFTVTGIDLVESKVERINAGDSYVHRRLFEPWSMRENCARLPISA